MSRLRRTRAGALAALWLGAACGEPPPAAPVEPRAAWLLEAKALRVGDVAALDRVVVTPPGWSVAPLAPPAAPDGFWLLDAEPLATERLASRWIQRTRLRIRAREVGRFSWPASSAEVEAPDGTRRRLELPALELEVVSVLPEAPDQLTPHGVRSLPEASARSLFAAAAGGAFAALAALAIGWVAVRRRRARAARSRSQPAGEPPESRASERLARARRALAGDPLRAADAIAAALRRFVCERYGVPALALSSEELAALPAPLALATRWTGLVSLLLALDAERFAPPGDAHSRARRLVALLDAAEAFVADRPPPAAPR